MPLHYKAIVRNDRNIRYEMVSIDTFDKESEVEKRTDINKRLIN